MKHCPNPDCLFLAEVGYIAEYKDHISTCFDCDTPLIPGEAPPLSVKYRPLFWQPADLVQTITTYVDKDEALADQEELQAMGITAAVKPELIMDDDGGPTELYHVQVQPATKARALEILDIDEEEIDAVDDEYWQQLDAEGHFTPERTETWQPVLSANDDGAIERVEGNVIQYKNSKWKYFGYLCASLVCVAMSILPIKEGDLFGWVFGGFTVFGMFIVCKQLVENKIRITIDNQGITDITLPVGKILWSDIEAAEKRFMGQQVFIALILHNEEKYLARLSPTQRRMTVLNRFFGAERLNLYLSGVNVKPDEILRIIHEKISNTDQ